MKYNFYPSDILLPDFIGDPLLAEKWSVIACDQFTSEPEYWQKAEDIVNGSPSTLRLMLPEAWLDRSADMYKSINSAMQDYIRSLLVCNKDSMICLERTLSDGSVRHGIIGQIDLEDYSYLKGSQSPIRATEGTVIERIPPRVEVRRHACLELPHVMLLIDDPNKTVIEPLVCSPDLPCQTAYSFDLMLNGGHVNGRFLSDNEKERVQKALLSLSDADLQKKKYGIPNDIQFSPLLFAVGDGNHSLAAAKAYYEELKTELKDKAQDHPARYALVEIVNLHEDSLHFEPIYRAVFGVNADSFKADLKAYFSGLNGNSEKQDFTLISNGGSETMSAEHPVLQLAVGTLQQFLDEYIKTHDGVTVDYIHGEDSLHSICKDNDTVGIMYDGIEKNGLFKTVILDGVLPRKAFSMGHACDKRYYLESRNIKTDKI